jgi:hypothetical protein
MLVVMKAQTTPQKIPAVCEYIKQRGLCAHALPGVQRTDLGVTGHQVEAVRA